MVADEREAEIRDELTLIDKLLAGRRQELNDLRAELRDPDDSGTLTRLIEEQETIITSLEARRAELLDRLSEPVHD